MENKLLRGAVVEEGVHVGEVFTFKSPQPRGMRFSCKKCRWLVGPTPDKKNSYFFMFFCVRIQEFLEIESDLSAISSNGLVGTAAKSVSCPTNTIWHSDTQFSCVFEKKSYWSRQVRCEFNLVSRPSHNSASTCTVPRRLRQSMFSMFPQPWLSHPVVVPSLILCNMSGSKGVGGQAMIGVWFSFHVRSVSELKQRQLRAEVSNRLLVWQSTQDTIIFAILGQSICLRTYKLIAMYLFERVRKVHCFCLGTHGPNQSR